jgi:hypothetical protein
LVLSIGLLSLATLASSGCLVVGAGLAGGAVAGYFYYNGKLAQRYQASFADTYAATRAALPELGLTVLEEGRDGPGSWLELRAESGERVRVFIDPQAPPAGGSGQLTQVSVRVGTFGDSPLSEKILEQIGRHLPPSSLLRPASLPAPAAVPPQTAPPPLLPAEPEKKG